MSISRAGQRESAINSVLEKLKLKQPVLLGKGGEGPVYEYGNYVLKPYPQLKSADYLHRRQHFLNDLTQHNFSFATPQILEIGEAEGVYYTIEKRLIGTPMDKKIVSLDTHDRQKLYQSYYDTIRQLHSVTYPNRQFGQIIAAPETVTANSWEQYLLAILDQQVSKTASRLRLLVPRYDEKTELMKQLILQNLSTTAKTLVHRDYYLNNVLASDDLELSAVLDFSIHTAVGDPRMDITSVLRWNELCSDVRPEDYNFLFVQATRDYGPDIYRISDIYLLFSAFYYADMEDQSFSAQHLNNESLWQSAFSQT